MNKKPTRSLSDLSPAQLKLVIVELQRKLASAASSAPSESESIAIVGLAGRYPGTGGTLDGFWEMMAQKRCAIRSAADIGGPPRLQATPEKKIFDGGYLDDLDAFDVDAFGVSVAEARKMDPQQRLLLETCWEALERAGLAGERHVTNTGVFLGVCTNDYAELLTRSGENWKGYYVLSNSHGLIAGRLSRELGLTGPSAAYNSVCASSMVAAFEGCRALQRGDCDAALICGVNLVISDVVNLDLAALNIISPTGRCRPYDAEADGYVRGEGCGAIILRRMSDAKAAGDVILAEIRGQGMTHDGPGQHMTPNRSAQIRAMKMALAEADVSPDAIGYLEAGSIGAPLADAVEGAALAEIFGRDREVPLRIGTLKPLIGHLEGAAGVAALTRVAMSLSRRTWLPHGGFSTANPHMDWCDGALVIDSAATAVDSRAPFASVNASSLSGTNVNFILAPVKQAVHERVPFGGQVPILLSARTEEGVHILAMACARRVAADPGCLQDLAMTLAVARSRLPVRAACVLGNPAEADTRLAALAPARVSDAIPHLAFAYGTDAMPPPPIAKTARLEIDALAIWTELGGAESAAARHLARTMANTAHLRLLGLHPSACGGHPLATAHAAGVLTPGDAIRLLHAHETKAPAPDVRTTRADCPVYDATGPVPDNALTAGALLAALAEETTTPVFSGDFLELGLGCPATITLSRADGWAAAVADLFVAGLPIKGAIIAAATGGRLTDAPVAAFNRRRFWLDFDIQPETAEHAPPVRKTEAEARAILDAILRDELGIDDFDDNTDLTTVGASSIEILRTMMRIEEQLGLNPDTDLFLADPSLAGLLSQYETMNDSPVRENAPEHEEGWI